MAVSIITFILALAGNMFLKDRLVRQGPEGWAKRSAHMGVGLVGKTLGQLGIGNIGAETLRLAKPFDMRFIAHDPYADPKVVAELGVELVPTRGPVPPQRLPLDQRPALGRDAAHGERAPALADEADRLPDQHRARADRRPGGALPGAEEGRIAGAGLDVFEVEPTPAGEPITKLDNVILAPHALCWTDQCFAGIGASDVAAVQA